MAASPFRKVHQRYGRLRFRPRLRVRSSLNLNLSLNLDFGLDLSLLTASPASCVPNLKYVCPPS